MKARVIEYSLVDCQAMEDRLNEWLDEAGEISVDKIVSLGTTNPGGTGLDRDCGALVILYREADEPASTSEVDHAPELVGTASSPTCRQCKKRPALEGMKMCGECREYQREYRKRQKEAKKKAMYP